MRFKVLHPITRLIVGGAQENTIYTCELLDSNIFDPMTICGPQTGSEGELITEARRRKVKISIIPELVRELHPVKDLIALLKLVNYIKREKAMIVHTHSSKAGILGRIAAQMAGVPVIVHTIHGWGFHERMGCVERFLYVTLEKIVQTFTDKLIAVSTLNIEKGLDAGISTREKYTVIHSGIDIDLYKNVSIDANKKKEELGIPMNVPIIGTVGRLSPQKCPQDFVKAAAEVLRKMPDAVFLYVGDGPLRQEIEELIQELGVSKNIILLGLRTDIPELLAVMDVFMLSSLWEGLPRVFLEAMSAGLPIVATNVDGASEAIKDEQNGFLVPPGDYKALASKIHTLIKNPQLIKDMGEASQRLMHSDFSVHTMVNQIQTLYQELLLKKCHIDCQSKGLMHAK